MRRRGPDRGSARATARRGRSRPKLDPRLAMLLSYSRKTLEALKERDLGRVRRVNDAARARSLEHAPDRRHFAPLTTGLYLTGDPDGVARYREPYVAVFIDSDASAEDLRRLGVRVRSQVGSSSHRLRPAPRDPAPRRLRRRPRDRAGAPSLPGARPGPALRADRRAPARPTGRHRGQRARRGHRLHSPGRLPSGLCHRARAEPGPPPMGPEPRARGRGDGPSGVAGGPVPRRHVRRRVRPGGH